jgi:trigger factor
MVEHEIDHVINDQLMRMGGMKLETYLGYRGLTEKDFRDELRPIAERRVTNSLVLNKVCEAENIEVSDSEVDAEVERMVQSAGEQSEQMKQIFNSPQTRESLRGELLTSKSIDRLVDIATRKDDTSAEEGASPSDAAAGEEKKEVDNDSTT